MQTKQEFIKKIKVKYPVYQSMDNDTLYKKIINKYPVYKKQIQPEKDTSFVGAMKNSASNIGNTLGEVAGNARRSLYKAGADVSKIKRGVFKNEIIGKPNETGGIEKGFIGNVLSGGIKRERAFAQKRAKQGNIGQTGIEKGFAKVGQGAGLAGGVIGEAFMSGLKTITTKEQRSLAKTAAQNIANSDIGQKTGKVIKDLGQGFNEFERQNPRTGSAIRSTTNIGLLGADVAGIGGASKVAQKVGTGIGERIDKINDVGVKIGSKTQDLGKSGIIQGAKIVKNIGGGIKDKTKIIGQKIEPLKQNLKVKGTIAQSGLTKEQVKGLQSNPYQADEFKKLTSRMKSAEGIDDIKNYKVERIGALTKELTNTIDKVRSAKGETSILYKSIRENKKPLKTSTMVSDIENTLKNKGLDIKDGEIIRLKGIKAGELNQSDVSKINQLYGDMMADIKKQGGKITAEQYLNLRKTASDLAKYDSTGTTAGQSIMRAIRKNIDNSAKEQVKGLRNLDAKFVDKLDEFDNAVKDLVYKGGDVKGEWRSNIVSIISNLDKANRARLLKRLDEVIPGIGDRIEAVNNLPSIYNTIQKKTVFDKYTGTFGLVTGTVLGGVVPGLGNVLGAILGYGGGKILEKGIYSIRIKAINKLLNSVSKKGIERLKEINKKIKLKETLTKKEKNYINSLKIKLKDDIKNSKFSKKGLGESNNMISTSKSTMNRGDNILTSNSMNNVQLKALPVGKTKIAKNIILPSKKPIILKAKVNKPIISTTKSKPNKPVVATKKELENTKGIPKGNKSKKSVQNLQNKGNYVNIYEPLSFKKTGSFSKFRDKNANYMIASAENPMGKQANVVKNKETHKAFGKFLKDNGITAKEQIGKYGQAENSYLIHINNVKQRKLIDGWLEQYSKQAENIIIKDGKAVRYDPRTKEAYEVDLRNDKVQLVRKSNVKDYYSEIDGRKYQLPLYNTDFETKFKGDFNLFYNK